MIRPEPGVMRGLTHSPDGQPLIRASRVLKVGVGIPRGRASYIYTHQGRWIIRYGVWKKGDGKDKLVMETAKGSDGKNGFPNRAECQEWYAKNKASFAVSNRPQKLQFFTFTHRRVVEEQGKPTEIFEPDFDAIEACGDTPTQLDVVLMSDVPLSGEYQAWSATELKCRGDGANALRVLSMGNAQWPGWQDAKDAGEKYFPIADKCWLSGQCPYAQEGGQDKLVCKPGTTLNFQLAANMRLGATAYFHTTSIRSTQQIFSGLYTIRMLVERAGGSIVGLPLKLVLAPFRSNHNGIPAIQPGVGLELRAADMHSLRKAIAESAWSPKQISAAPKMIEGTTEEEDVIVTDAPMEDVSAPGIAAEFYPDFDDEDGATEDATAAPVSTASAAAASKTEEKAAALAEKLTRMAAKSTQEANTQAPLESGGTTSTKEDPAPAKTTPTATATVTGPALPESGLPWGLTYAKCAPWQKNLLGLRSNNRAIFDAEMAKRGMHINAVTQDMAEGIAKAVLGAVAATADDGGLF
jgi:recombination directionality factor gp3-like protein